MAGPSLLVAPVGRLISRRAAVSGPTYRTRLYCVVTSALLVVVTNSARGVAPQRPSLDQIIEVMQSAHRDLLHSPKGLSVPYSLDVKGGPTGGSYPFSDVRGRIALKWPKLYCRFAGQSVETRRRVVYEAEYNFQTNTSLAVTSLTPPSVSDVHFTPFRHAWTGEFNLPLQFLYFAEGEQRYVADMPLKRTIMLPDVLEQNKASYRVEPAAVVAGSLCILVERAGYDRLWLAPEHGYACCKREIYHGPGKALRQRSTASEFVKVGRVLWMPCKVVRELYRPAGHGAVDVNSLDVTLTLGMRPTDATVDDADLRVTIPERAHVVDQVRNRHYYYDKTDRMPPFYKALVSARAEFANQRPSVARVCLWAATAGLLAAGLGLAWYRAQRSFGMGARKRPSS